MGKKKISVESLISPVDYTIIPTQPESFEYTTPNNIKYTITNLGLSQIEYGSRMFATGGIFASNGNNFIGNAAFNDGVPIMSDLGTEILNFNRASYSDLDDMYTDIKDQINQKYIYVYGSGESAYVLVTHIYGNGVIVDYSYSFKDEDIIITATIKNNTTNFISVPSIGGLKLTFERDPDGIYTQFLNSDNKPKLGPYGGEVDHLDFGYGFKTNTQQKISGIYLIDEELGIGASPYEMGPIRQSFNVPLIDSHLTRYLEYYCYKPIYPGGSEKISIKIRASDDLDWQNLLEPYKEELLRTHGLVKYSITDNRYILQYILTTGIQAVNTVSNPYGLDSNHRLDSPSGTASMVSTLNSINGSKGAIFWDLQGRPVRSGMYPSSFDVWAPEIETNFIDTFKPALINKDMQFGTLSNFTLTEVQNDYYGWSKTDIDANGESTSVPLPTYVTKNTFTSAVTSLFSLWHITQGTTVNVKIQGTWTGTIELQDITTDTPTVLGTYSSAGSGTEINDSIDISNLLGTLIESAALQFVVTPWTSGTAYVRMYQSTSLTYAVSGTWTGSIDLQYLNNSNVWTTHTTITSNTGIDGVTITNIPTKWRFISTAWTSGSATCIVTDGTRLDTLSLRFSGQKEELELFENRVQNVVDRGGTLFYTDKSGPYYECYLAARYLRDKFNSVQFLYEHSNDYCVPYVGFLTNTDFVKNPIGTIVTKNFTGISQTNTESIFRGNLITVTLSGTLSAGNIKLQKRTGEGSWTDVATYTSLPVDTDVDSEESLKNDIRYRLLSSADFSGNVDSSLQDNTIAGTEGSLSTTVINAQDMTTDSPTPRFQNKVMIYIYGTWTGKLYLERYDKDDQDWVEVAQYTSNLVNAVEFDAFNSHWRVRSDNVIAWTGTATIALGESCPRMSYWFIKLMQWIFGDIEVYARINKNLEANATLNYGNDFKDLCIADLMDNKVALIAKDSETSLISSINSAQTTYLDENNLFS